MDLLFLVLIFCFFLFLYVVYELVKDDFVILRKNISAEKIFNSAFLIAILALFSSRLIYVLSNPSLSYLNPLIFLIFPYYPGLSLIGGVVGGILFSFAVLKNWEMPVGRITDFFSMSFASIFPLGFLLSIFTARQKNNWVFFILLLLYILLFIFLIRFILPKTLGGKLKDGSLTSIFAVLFSLVYFLSNIFIYPKNIFNLENFLSILMFLGSLFFLMQYEGMEKLFRR